ncbi:hypothetical protein [Acinetobacter towneri]|uniref:hypothetical protein n=1 Tax=Acinetobacter towneri TaxID=202956 RepID=UPI0025781944|nr:hypothetical protein [Acinetobacter towneri]MDM1720494.1 hypothetical protein [Acinetobacter towneri]
MEIILKLSVRKRGRAALSNAVESSESKESISGKAFQFGRNIGSEALAAISENVGKAQCCSIKFKFSAAKDGSSEDLEINYEYIPYKSGRAKKFFKGVANIRKEALKELTFIKYDNFIKIRFAAEYEWKHEDIQPYKYEVIAGDVDKLFNLVKK